ncbi:ABC transporter ATP-binding protein [Actinomadura scrupuli]|uniref:ABC transporter ATP-binding protein n=1 Tax=Actinomadura scrupuli TaxID=559629 RepID=UPI003D985510
MNTVIEVRDLYVTFGRPSGTVEAVRGVSFTVARGRIHVLLGRFGAGRTTVLEVVSGHRRPTAGAVRVRGVDPYARPEAVRTGTVWREGGLFPGLTVAEVVDTWRRWTLDPITRHEALWQVGLGARATARFEELSAGERRRLDLALALVGRSDVLFLDEPMTGLDPEARRQVWATLRSLARHGVAILMTSGDPEDARLADQFAIMSAGRMLDPRSSPGLRAA